LKGGENEMVQKQESKETEEAREALKKEAEKMWDVIHTRVRHRMRFIKHKIAVISGKGGVGKTTVAVNLAYALALKGYKVGILDADITGPNVPKMLGIAGKRPSLSADGSLIPIQVLRGQLEVISMDSLLPSEDTPVIWRGPLIMKAIQQFLSDVDWREQDFLIVDLPPGTGDETLSIMQLLPDMDGIIVVTTPQEVALLDVKKSIKMADKMTIPIIGVIENMSGFVCPKCGEKILPFKEGGGEKAAKEYGVRFLGRIPLNPEICESGDEGKPFVEKESEISKEFMQIVEKIIKVVEGEEK